MLRRTLRGACALTILAGCARRTPVAGASDSAADRRPPREEQVALVVENRNSSDVVVTVVGGGGRRLRVGTVSGSSTRQLAFPATLAAASQPVSFVAHPVGARDSYTSERLTVQSGQQVVLTVGSRLSQSSVRLQ